MAGAAWSGRGTGGERGAIMLHDANGEPFDAPLLFTDVHMDVTGMLARVQVRQRFASPSREWMEGVYGFALPEKAAVDHMTMTSASRQTFSISETARRRRHADRRNT
jgi:Ca-activated chloride channel family protein